MEQLNGEFMVKNGFIALLLFVCTATFAQKIEINTENALVEFVFIEKGTKGTFDNVTVSVMLNPKDLSQSIITGEAEVSSFRTDSPDRDKSMKSDHHFDAENFPKITFEGKDVVQEEGNSTVIGMLTIKGVSKETVFNFSIQENEMIFETLINAADFGVGIKKEKELNGVQVTIRIPLQ